MGDHGRRSAHSPSPASRERPALHSSAALPPVAPSASAWRAACWRLRCRPRTSAARSACRAPGRCPAPAACSSTSTRAQSIVSLIDGTFFRSSVRNCCTKPTSSRRSCASMPGTRDAMIRAFQLRVREADMQMQAAPLQRVAQVARAVRGQQHDRRRHGLRHCRSRGSSPGSPTGSPAGTPRTPGRTCRSRRSAAPRRPAAAAHAAAAAAPGTAREKKMSPNACSLFSAAARSSASPITSPILSFRIWV